MLTEPSVILRPVKLSWLHGAADDPTDLCVHARVDFRIGDHVLVDAERDLEVTVSAAGLYLMRTLERDHTRKSPVGDHLFPCCGFTLYEEAGSLDVVIIGCPNGVDFEVTYAAGDDRVLVRAMSGREWEVARQDWRSAVFSFADAVSNFVATASPKTTSVDDAAGFRKFLTEWERRRGRPFGARPV